MVRQHFNDRIDALFRRGEWEEARKLLEREQAKEPENHWLLTQRGVTLYEQKRYEEALTLLLQSLKIVPDCPLTLWNLAGTLDQLGDSLAAIRIYTWLLESDRSPEDDPCWESEAWTDGLKTDSVYRLGVCLEHRGEKKKAELCYRQYLNLLLSGVEGTYPLEDVIGRIRGLHNFVRGRTAEGEGRKAVRAALQAAGIKPSKGRRDHPPEFEKETLAIGRRSSRKK